MPDFSPSFRFVLMKAACERFLRGASTRGANAEHLHAEGDEQEFHRLLIPINFLGAGFPDGQIIVGSQK
jgi:hypothetical protein